MIKLLLTEERFRQVVEYIEDLAAVVESEKRYEVLQAAIDLRKQANRFRQASLMESMKK